MVSGIDAAMRRLSAEEGKNMTRPRRTRRDRNQAALLAELEARGMVVWDLSDLGGKILDAIAFWRGRAVPVEIKAPGCERDLTDGERASIEALRGVGVEPVVATRAEDVTRRFEEGE